MSLRSLKDKVKRTRSLMSNSKQWMRPPELPRTGKQTHTKRERDLPDRLACSFRIKEQELQSAQLVSSFIQQNLSADEHSGGAPETSSVPRNAATLSFYDLPPSRIFTPAPLRMIGVESHPHSSVTSSLPEPSLPIVPSASQTLHIPQKPQQSIDPVQPPSLPHIASAQAAQLRVPTLSTLALPYTSHHTPSQVAASSFSNVNAPPANVQAPHGAAVLPDPE